MNICQLIGQEIELIQQEQLDMSNLSPENYYIYLEKLSVQVKRLEKIVKLLLFAQNFDNLVLKNIIDVSNITIDNLAVNPEDINDQTIVFVGDLRFLANNIPPNLKVIAGQLVIKESDISSIDLDYVEHITVSRSQELKSIFIKHVGKININNCRQLNCLRVLNIRSYLRLKVTPALTIENISSLDIDKKIILGDTDSECVINTPFTQEEIESKFIFSENSKPYEESVRTVRYRSTIDHEHE